MILKTPLLRKLREKGATMYVFPSANEDIGLNLDSRTTGVALSHYALLNMPGITSTTSKIDGAELLALDLLNYVMNFETVLLNLNSYNYQDYHTVSERVFWHWMYNKMEHIDFEKINNTSYIKEDYTLDKNSDVESDDRVVVCFGSIDAGNSLSTEFGIFNETYINIPTSYGAGPVFFKLCGEDLNYRYKKYSSTNTNTLEGRYNDNTGYLTSNIPIYDESNTNSYDTTQKPGKFESIEILKDINEISSVLKLTNNNIEINSFDDINVDINNQLNLTHEFKFNTILLYYSIYDQDDTTKSPYAINLFGVIFLDGPIKNNNDNTFYITPFIKKKSTDGYFGNSYSFRVNIKTMSVYDNTDATIYDNTTLSSISSVDFSDVISNLNRAIDTMNTNVHTTAAIQNAYMNILTYYDDQRENIKLLLTLVDSLINGSATNVFNTSALLVNAVSPSIENGIISFNVYKEYNDFTDSLDKQKYTDSIIIRNNHNIPAVYYPQVNLTEEFSSVNEIVILEDVSIKDIIKSIDISWYTNKSNKIADSDTFIYPIMQFNKDVLNNNNLRDLIDSSNNINDNMLLTCLLDYVLTLDEINISADDINDALSNNDEFKKIIENNVSIYVQDLSTRINENTIKITNNINSLLKPINISINDLYTQINTIKGSSSDDSALSAYILIINRNSESIVALSSSFTDFVNNTYSPNINNINTSINNINSSISNINSSINNIKNNIQTINTELNDVWGAINGHTATLKIVQSTINDILKKINDILTWRTM